MSSDVVANPPVSAESKSARKKKAKAELAGTTGASAAAPVTASSENAPEDGKLNGADVNENAYVRELQKNIRNVNKKLNLMQKTDSIIAENPNTSLEDLVASKKINADQRAQVLKKPQLQAQLAQFEEQLAQWKKIDHEYQTKLSAEKDLLQSSHKQELEKLRDVVKAEVAAEEKNKLKQRYLTVSKFLHTAAAKRQLDEPDTEERQAFEGVLLLVYGGDTNAVEAIEKLVEGSDDIVSNIEGTPTGVPFSQIRDVSLAGGPIEDNAQFPAEGQQHDTPDTQDAAPTSDPTIAHAGLTEIQEISTATNGAAPEASSAPAAASIDAEASNAAADEQWDQAVKGGEDSMAESFEIVPRDPAETETPTATTSTQSWADDAAAASAAAPVGTTATTGGGDGFHEVHHQRGGRGRGDGRVFRGRGRGGDRGRGHRGDGRGRGGRGGGFRGRPRGDGAPPS